MSNFSFNNSRNGALLLLGLAIGVAAPIVISAPATAANFMDVQEHWARPFIEALAEQNIISGYSDKTFRPDQSVTRAQFAAMLKQAFDENNVQFSRKFDRAAAEDWASRDLTNGRSSNRQLRPSDPLSKVQVLVALAKGLGLNYSGSVTSSLNIYRDASTIPEYARESVAAATQQGIVVNYPDVANFNPSKTATRADISAFIYQTLVNEGVLAPISNRLQASNYIVQVARGSNQVISDRVSTQSTNNNRNTRTDEYKILRGTQIKVTYKTSSKVVVAPGETQNLTLLVAEDIKNSRGETLIPKDSEIEGQIVPRYNGSSFLGAQFVAQRLIIRNDSYSDLNVTSLLVTGQPTAQAGQQTLGDAAISAAAQVILGGGIGRRGGIGDILGGGGIGDILGGGGIGNILGGGGIGNILGSVLSGRGSNQQQQQNTLIVIEPGKDLQLTLGSDFYVNRITQAPYR
ncbi:MAG TPA: S-layer homology domain-containing protein [Coleofasciculaceae cyanobacterium]|jgi:hypothetical protein